MEYRPTIGLEIHAELKTRTKMFCDSLNDPSAASGQALANTNTCPICLGHPGTLPVANKKAIEAVIRVGLALGGTIGPVTKFDRKNYFYPDLPKGYQISQYDQPLVVGGNLKGARITRIHLEEDTGRLVHESPANGKSQMANRNAESKMRSAISDQRSASFVDYNRAGIPLMELVTEPDLHGADEVVEFARELQLILRYLGVSDADMEKGQMRIEANVSIAPIANRESQSEKLGTKVELKNINSFRAAYDAVEYEIKRQAEVLEGGGKITQETRGWDENKQKTVSQRSKEEAHDYRYFPDPDLPPFETAVFDLENLRRELPELPQAKRERFAAQFNLSEKQADFLASDVKLADFFEQFSSEAVAAAGGDKVSDMEAKAIAALGYSYLTSDLQGLLKDANKEIRELKFGPVDFASLIDKIRMGKIGSRQAKDILKIMFETGENVDTIIEQSNLSTVTDEAVLKTTVAEVLSENPTAVADYKAGKVASLQFMLGAAMKKLRGRGNPEVLKTMFMDELE